MQDLKRLLEKKHPSGRDLGRISAADIAIALEARRQGKVSLPIMDSAKFNDDLNALDNEEWAIFNQYKYLSDFLNLYYNIAEGMAQQADHAHTVLNSVLSESALSEDTFAYISKLPAIMTQEQFEAEKAKGIYKWTHDQDGELRMWSIMDLFCYALTNYMTRLQEFPRRKNPLQPIKKKYQGEPIKSDIALSRYNKAAKYGYYELPDGKRSDRMTPSRWKRATQSPKMRKILSADMADNVEDWKSLNELIEGLNLQRIRRIWESNEELPSEAEKEALIEAGFLVRQEFKLYEEPPAGLTKWDVVKDLFVLLEIYPAALGDNHDQEAYEEEMSDFTDTFSDMVAAIVDALDSENWIDIHISDVPFSVWNRPIISLQALYDMNFYGMADRVNLDKETLFPDNERARYNGVAVLQELHGLFEPPTDARGYFIPPTIMHNIGNPYSLEDLLEGAEDYDFMADLIEDNQNALLDSHYFLKNWNILIDMVDEIYEVPRIDVYRIDYSKIEKYIDELNGMTMDLYNQVYRTDYGEMGDFQRHFKLEAIKKHLGEIDYSNSEAPNENINKIYSLLTDTRLFSAPEIIEGLMLRRITEPTE